jgi:hypothetical protein
VNDSEIDDLIAAAAPVSDAEVSRWDLTGTDIDLRDEIMSPRRRRLTRIATATAVAAAAAALSLTGTTEPIAASTIDAAVAASSSALERSGRADLHYHLVFDDGYVADGVEHWAFSGNEVRITIPRVDYELELGMSLVDDQMELSPYLDRQIMDRIGIGDEVPVGADESGAYGLDPRTLLEGFRSSSTFEENGTDEVDGVDCHRLTARSPGEAPPIPIMGIDVPGDVTSLEVCVDDEDLVRRLDITTQREGFVEAVSVQFFDLGEPVEVDLPGLEGG